VCDTARTESPFLDLLRCQGKHREQLHHYFHHDVRQYRSGRNSRIDLETLKEDPQTLEQLENSIVTGCNPTGSLVYSFITGRPLKTCGRDVQQGEYRYQQTMRLLVERGSDGVTVKRVGVTEWHVWLTWLTAPKIPENACKIVTAGVRQFINLRFPSRYSSKLFSRSLSSWRIASGEFDRSRAAAKGVFERSVPVILV
jgi:hypothetical protein